MANKLLPYGRQSIDKRDVAAVEEVLRSDWLTTGPKVEEFEQAFARWVGARYAVSCSSGTAALHLCCLAAGLGPGHGLVTSTLTFAASANCAFYVGARPLLADIDPHTLNLTPEELERRIPPGMKGAVVPVHFAGLPCDMEGISKVARDRGLIVIEDACHALGAEYAHGGGRVGSCRYSDLTVFSFHPVKHITTGEGGMVTTNDPGLYRRLLRFRNHGITRDRADFQNPEKILPRERELAGPWYYQMLELGFNYRLNDLQAALGLSQLRKLGEFLDKRQSLADFYFHCLEGAEHLVLPPRPRRGQKHAWHLYVVRLKDPSLRRVVFERMRQRGIGVQVHYVPVHLHPYYQERLGTRWGDFPRAEEYYRRAITLPLYASLKREEADYVARTLVSVLEELCSPVQVQASV